MNTSKVFHYGRQIIRNANGIVGLHPDDVWLTSFPRSGNSWIRIIFANIIQLSERDGKEVELWDLPNLVPSLGVSNLLKPWPYQSLPRFVKTHHPFRRPFFAKPRRSILLVRDPRDAILSYYDLAQKSKIVAFRGEFSEFLRHPKYGLSAWIRHYQSWESMATVLLKYEELRKDTVGTLQGAFANLSVDMDRKLIENAIERSAIDQMRKKEAETGIRDPGRFDANFRAVRTGKTHGWQEAFSDADLQYYQTIFVDTHGYNYDSMGLMNQA
ncbi:MAG: sulfotransferase domain-containing protein [Chloroflexota bacterium]